MVERCAWPVARYKELSKEAQLKGHWLRTMSPWFNIYKKRQLYAKSIAKQLATTGLLSEL